MHFQTLLRKQVNVVQHSSALTLILPCLMLFACLANSQLLRLLPVEPQLASLLGREHSLASLLAAQPSLLRMDPQSLQANCAHLQELLGQQAAAAAVRRCPQVLGCSPFRCAERYLILTPAYS